MTQEEIKEKLPPVQIEINGKIYTGQIQGRMLDFPFIFVPLINYKEEFSWVTITRAINENRTLKG